MGEIKQANDRHASLSKRLSKSSSCSLGGRFLGRVHVKHRLRFLLAWATGKTNGFTCQEFSRKGGSSFIHSESHKLRTQVLLVFLTSVPRAWAQLRS